MTRGICDGLVVIEMGAGSVPAALAGMLLADNGATRPEGRASRR